jgi:hypothetical protein
MSDANKTEIKKRGLRVVTKLCTDSRPNLKPHKRIIGIWEQRAAIKDNRKVSRLKS